MRKYYQRYPEDVGQVQRIVLRLLAYPEGGAPLPDGGILRPRGLQLLGEPSRLGLEWCESKEDGL